MLVISADVAAIPIAQGASLVFNGVQQVKPLTGEGIAMMTATVGATSPAPSSVAAAADDAAIQARWRRTPQRLAV